MKIKQQKQIILQKRLVVPTWIWNACDQKV